MLPINFNAQHTLWSEELKKIVIMEITQIISEAKEILPDTCHLHFLKIKLG